MTVTVHQFSCLEDNYGFLVRDHATGETACIDTPDTQAILRELDGLGWELTLILNTHWHPDHAGGNESLKAATGARVYAPAEVRAHYPVDDVVADGDVLHLGGTLIEVLDSGGHTHGHIVYFLPDAKLLFAGDTLFPMGCGKLFEGTPEQMWRSLSGLARLPEDTSIYSAHEYTLGNARFALEVDSSAAVIQRAAAVEVARAAGRWTVPTTMSQELATNPFLRAPQLEIARGAASDAEAFARVRAAKDQFKG